MTSSILIRCVKAMKFGGPDVLSIEVLPLQTFKLEPNELLVKNLYAGVNFIDIYSRTGLYPLSPERMNILGQEGSGVVVQCGDGLERDQWLNKRVAYFQSVTGSYSSFVKLDERDAFVIPSPAIDDRTAAAVLLQGCTAHYLVNDCYNIKEGDIMLVHAAAGGTGSLLCQLGKLKGAIVIGICGSSAKAEVATKVGKCDYVIDYSATPDWFSEVQKALTVINQKIKSEKGEHGEMEFKKCDVVYDGVGKSVFNQSLKCLKRRGYMVTFGNASGAVDPIKPLELAQAGSLFLTRPKLFDYMFTKKEADARVNSVFDLVLNKKIEVTICKDFMLGAAADAHKLLESKGSIGKLLLNCQE